MRSAIAILVAAAAVGVAAPALANRPLAVLPSGAVVDLDTGIATTPAGAHYRVPAAELKALRANPPAPPAAKPPAPGGGDKPPSGHKDPHRPPQ